MLSTDATILTHQSDAQKRMREYSDLFEKLDIIVYTKSAGQLPIHLTDQLSIYPTNTRTPILYFWQAYQLARQIIRNHPNTIVSCQDPFETGIVGWLLKIWHRAPLHIQIHTDFFSPYFSAESWKNKGRVFLAKRLIARADRIRVVSQRIQESLVKQLAIDAEKIDTLPIFVDVQKIENAKIKVDLHSRYLEYDVRILMASRLTQEKNIELAIHAVAHLAKEYPKLLLLIVGEGPEKQKLEILSQHLQMEKNVRFEPWTDDLASYYKTSDIFLLTSNYEGYGRTVVEAMAAGTLVVMTDVGLAGEVLIDDLDGLVIPVQDQSALEKALQIVLTDAERRSNYVREATRVITSYGDKKTYLRAYHAMFSHL